MKYKCTRDAPQEQTPMPRYAGRGGWVQVDGDGQPTFRTVRQAGEPVTPGASESYPLRGSPGLMVDVVYLIRRALPVIVGGIGLCAAMIAAAAYAQGWTFAAMARAIFAALIGG